MPRVRLDGIALPLIVSASERLVVIVHVHIHRAGDVMFLGVSDGVAEAGGYLPPFSAAINSLRLRTVYTFSLFADAPPVVPVPWDAQPSFGASVSLPRSRFVVVVGQS